MKLGKCLCKDVRYKTIKKTDFEKEAKAGVWISVYWRIVPRILLKIIIGPIINDARIVQSKQYLLDGYRIRKGI